MLVGEGRRFYGPLDGGNAVDCEPIKWHDTNIDPDPGSTVEPPTSVDSGLDSALAPDLEADPDDDDLLDLTLEEQVDDEAVSGLDQFFASLRARVHTNALLGGLESSTNHQNSGSGLNGSNGAPSPATALQHPAAVSGPPEPAPVRAEVSGERWRERALVWRERALSAETLAKALERHVQDLRANIEELRSPAAPVALEAPLDAVAPPDAVAPEPAERRRFFGRRRHEH